MENTFYQKNIDLIKFINANYRLRYRNLETKENILIGAGQSYKYFNENALILAFNELKKNFKEKYTLWDRKHSRIEFSLK